MSETRIENLIGRVRLYRDWYKVTLPLNYLLDSLGVRPIVHLRRGPALRVRIFGDDLPILAEIFGNDSYGLKSLSLGERPVVVDIGANIGAFAAAIRHRFPGASIAAYEPHPDNFSLLRRNAPFAELHEEAVAGTAGEARLLEGVNASALRLAERGTAVRAVTLESVLARHARVDLLKVDIEGAEYEVFAATPPAALGIVRRAVVEVHKAEWRPWFETYFAGCGFSVRWDKDLLIAEK